MGILSYCERTDLFNRWKATKKAKVVHLEELIECKKYLNALDQVWEQTVPTEPNKEPEDKSPLPEGQEEAQQTSFGARMSLHHCYCI